MKKLIGFVCAVVGISTGAFATTYVWNGSQGDGLWATPANWTPEMTSSTSDDTIQIGKEATITLPAGETKVKNFYFSTGGFSVTLNGADDTSKIVFENNTNDKFKFVGSKYLCKVYLNVEVSATPSGSVTYSQNGLYEIHISKDFKRLTTDNVNYLGGYGAYYLDGGTMQFCRDTTLGWCGGSSSTAYMHVGSGAEFVCTNYVSGSDRGVLKLVGNGSTRTVNAVMDQTAGSTVQVNTLNIGSDGGCATMYREGTYARYEMNGGTLTVNGTMSVGPKGYYEGVDKTTGPYTSPAVSGTFIQTAGDTTVKKVYLGPGMSATDRFAILGGTFTMTGTDFTYASTNTTPVELSNCTFKAQNTLAIDKRVVISGTVTLDIPSGKTLTLSNVKIAEGGKIRQTGEGKLTMNITESSTLNVDSDLTFDYLKIGAGTKVVVKNGATLTTDYLYMADGETPDGIEFEAGSTFKPKTSMSVEMPFRVKGAMTVDLSDVASLNIHYLSVAEGATMTRVGTGKLYVDFSGDNTITTGTWTFDEVYVGVASYGNLKIAGDADVTAATLKIGSLGTRSAVFEVAGGTVTVPGLSASSSGILKISGGRYTDDTVQKFQDGALAFELCGGTFVFNKAWTVNTDFRITGDATIETAAGVLVIFNRSPVIEKGGKLTKAGAGTIRLDKAAACGGDLEVAEGTFKVQADLTKLSDAPITLTIRDGAVFDMSGANWTAMIHAPVNLKVYDGGYILRGNRDGVFPVRALWTNDVAVARGTAFYTTATTDETSFYRSSASAGGNNGLYVTYTWTGAGADNNWRNADNWEGGEIPVDHVKSYADILAAEEIVLTDNIDILGLCYMGSATAKKVRVKSDSETVRTFYALQANYQPGTYVASGCELIFDHVLVKRSNTTGNSVGYWFGTGAIALEGPNQAAAEFAGGPRVGCELLYRNTTNTAYSIGFYGFAINSDVAQIIFDRGCDVRAQYSRAGNSGHSVFSKMTFRNGTKVTFSEAIYVSRHHSTYGYNVNLEDGEVTVNAGKATNNGLMVGVSQDKNNDNRRMWGQEQFNMWGGTLTVPKVGCECNRNYLNLMGGTINVGAGGVMKVDSHTGNTWGKWSFTENTDAPIRWGGTKICATASSVFDLDIDLTGTGGTPELEVAEGETVMLEGTLAGTATLAKSGAGTLVITNGATAAISLNVKAGTLKFGEDTDFTTPLTTLALAEDANLVLAKDQALKVKTFAVGKVAKAVGTYVWGEGRVEVVGNDDWLASAQYIQNCNVVLDAAKTVSGIDYGFGGSGVGTLTISGEAALTFAAGSTIRVQDGDTLVLNVPVTLEGQLDIVGGGTVEFGGAVTAPTDPTYVLVREGSQLTLKSEVNARAKGVSMYAITETSQTRKSKIVIGNGGYLKQQYYVCTCPYGRGYDSSVGGTLQIDEGGTFALNNTDNYSGMGRYSNWDERLILNGGTLDVPTYITHLNTGVGHATLDFRSGTVKVNNTGTLFNQWFTITLGGEVKFDIPENKYTTIAANIEGAGTLRPVGAGEVILMGGLSGVTGYAVDAGTLTVTDRAFESCNSAADVCVQPGAVFGLDYTGAMTIKTLHLGKRRTRVGIYNEANGRGLLTGAGSLAVTKSCMQGISLIIK